MADKIRRIRRVIGNEKREEAGYTVNIGGNNGK